MNPLLRHVALVLFVCSLCASPGLKGQVTDMVTYFGGDGNQRLHTVHPLSDGTFLIGGQTTSLDWIPVGVPVTQMDATGLSSRADNQIAFIAQFNADFTEVLRIVHFPQHTAASVFSIRSSEVPGDPTGHLIISGRRENSANPPDQIPGYSGGYFLARLNGNFVDVAPTAVEYIFNVNASGRYLELQPWDVRSDGYVVFGRGASNSNEAWLEVLNLNGERVPMTGWLRHTLQDMTLYYGPYSDYNDPGNPIIFSTMALANYSQSLLRSPTWEDFDAIVPNGNAGWRKGVRPNDLFGWAPNAGGGRGYTSYSHSSPSFGIGQIAVDRRDNSIYIPHNQQTNHGDNYPDFEAAITALNADGSFRWFNRLYEEFLVAHGVNRTQNGATSWAASNTGLENRHVRALAVHPTDGNIVYAGTYAGVFKSTDGGANWSAANNGLTAPRILAIAVHPTQPNVLYAATNQGAFKSTNSAASWTAVNAGLTDLYLTSLVVHPTNADIAYAGTGGSGMFKTTDGGLTWTAINSGIDSLPANMWINAIAIDPQEPDTLWLALGGGDGVLRTTNGGASWAPANHSSEASNWRSHVFGIAVHRPHVSAPAVLYAGTALGIYKSTDGADNWVRSFGTGPAPVQARCFVFHPTNPDVAWAGTTYAGLWKTVDGGATWTRNNSGLFFSPNTVQIINNMVYALAIHPVDPDTLWLGSLGYPKASIPDQYGDAAEVDYSRPLAEARVLVAARSHGNDHSNLWEGNWVSPLSNPDNPGFAYQNRVTGTMGDIHIAWLGKFRAADGVLQYATRLAEFPYSNTLNVGSPYSDPNLAGWPNKNEGNPNLNTTRIDPNRIAIDALGRPVIAAVGRMVHTTANAYQRTPNRYRRVSLTTVESASVFQSDALIGNDELTAGAATLTVTSSGANQNQVRTITDFNPITGVITLASDLPAVPAVGTNVRIDEGASGWSGFVRTYSEDYTTLVYSSNLTGVFDTSVMSSATGGGNTVLRQALPLNYGPNRNGVLVIGYHTASSGVANGNPVPTRQVPDFGSSVPTAETGIIARFSYEPLPRVYVESVAAVITEGDSSAIRFFRTGDTSVPLQVHYTLSGSAVEGMDFAAMANPVTIPAGSSTYDLPFNTIDNSLIEPDRELLLTLADDDLHFVTGRTFNSASITILDDDGAGQLEFDPVFYSVAEGTAGNTVTLSVIRANGVNGAISVQYATVPGTAGENDYVPTSGTLSWADGESGAKTFDVQILADGLEEGTELFTVQLSNPTGGAVLGSASTATVEILDTFIPGTLQFQSVAFSDDLGRGFTNVLVTRAGGASGPVSVDYVTLSDTAEAGTHFRATSGTLYWDHDDDSTRIITIPFIDDPLTADDVTLFVRILNPTGGAGLGAASIVPVAIVYDKVAGNLGFSVKQAAVNKDAGTVTAAVVRTGGASGAVSIDYATANGTAVAGTHYMATTGTLHWADGDNNAKAITVPILSSVQNGQSVSFTIGLSSPSGGAVLVDHATHTVQITDQDHGVLLDWNNGSGDWQWNTTSSNWNSGSTAWSDGLVAVFNAGGLTGTSNTIAIPAAGVSPNQVRLITSGGSGVAHRFNGGPLLTGSIFKANNREAQFIGYTGGMPFEGGVVVSGTGTPPGATTGVLLFTCTTSPAATQVQFGTSAIVLRNFGGFRFISNANLTNDFIVEATGGKIGFNGVTNGVPAIFSGNIMIHGDLQFAATGGGNLGGYGHQFTGTFFLDGDRTLSRVEAHGNTNLGFMGPIVDGANPGTLRLASRIDRQWFIVSGENAYTGGTVIESINKVFSTDMSNFGTNRAVVVEPGARLGTGNVTVNTNGYLVLRGNTNIHPDARLDVAGGGAVWIHSGVSVTVGGLSLDGVEQAPGVYDSTHPSGLLYGAGEILVIAPMVEIEAVQDAIPGVQNGQFRLTRYGNVGSNLTVHLSISGTAANGTDYENIGGTFVIPAGSLTALLEVIPIGTPAGGKTVDIALLARDHYRFGDTVAGSLAIFDANAPGVISFVRSSSTVFENVGSVTLTVSRSGGSNGVVAVSYTTVDGTAVAGLDYVAAAGTLQWADGDAADKTIVVTILDDAIPEPNEFFTVQISSPSGGASLGSQTSHTVEIIDNDGLTVIWNYTGTTDRKWDQTSPYWVGPGDVFQNGYHAVFTATGAHASNAIVIDAAGVLPASTSFSGGTGYLFTGGAIHQGSILKEGTSTVAFGSASAPYSTDFLFDGGMTIKAGTVAFFNNRTTAPNYFGTGPIVLDGGRLTYHGNGDPADGAVNGALMTPIVVTPNGGTLQVKQIASLHAGSHGGRIDLYGNLNFDGIGGGNGPAGTGDRLFGEIYLHGEHTITRGDRHNNTNAGIIGTIKDGDIPGTLRIANRLARRFDLDGLHTYTGGTVFPATVSFDTTDAAIWTNKRFAVYVRPTSKLGTGNVRVNTGGFAWFGGPLNIDPSATLTLDTASFTVVDAGQTVVVRVLQMGNAIHTSGTFDASNAVGFLYDGSQAGGGGSIQVVYVPEAPTSLSAVAASASQVDLVWEDNAIEASPFEVQRRLLSGGEWQTIATISAGITEYSDTDDIQGNTNYLYRIRAVNANGESDWSNESLASTPPVETGDPYAAWAQTVFSPQQLLDPAISGLEADPDRDGLNNLLEFAFNLDPLTPDRAGAGTILAFDGNGDRVFSFVRRMDPTGLDYRVGVSTALDGNWDFSGQYLESVGAPVPTGDGITEEVTVRLLAPLSSAERVFLVLQVTLNP